MTYHNTVATIEGGKQQALTEEQKTARIAEEAESIARKKATEYIRKRVSEYPPIVEQLDMIFHDGIENWKAHIQAIKERYPKT